MSIKTNYISILLAQNNKMRDALASIAGWDVRGESVRDAYDSCGSVGDYDLLIQDVGDKSVSGMCGTCKYRNDKGYCTSEKLAEEWGQTDTEKADMLLYDHSEGGGFLAGERFGCIHYAPRKMA